MTTGDSPKDTSSRITNFYPLEMGNEWSYRISGDVSDAGETVTFAVVHSSGQLESREFVITRTVGDDLEPIVLVESREGLHEEGTDIFLLKRPLEKSQRWTGTIYGSENGLLKFEVLDTAQTIHAGVQSFAGCVVIQMTDEARQRTERVTYAPAVGPVLYSGSIGNPAVESLLTITSWKIQEVA